MKLNGYDVKISDNGCNIGGILGVTLSFEDVKTLYDETCKYSSNKMISASIDRSPEDLKIVLIHKDT